MKTLWKKIDIKIPSFVFFSVIIIYSVFEGLFLLNNYLKFQDQLNRPVTQAKFVSTSVSPKTSSKSTVVQKPQTAQASAPVLSGTQLKVPVLYYHYVGNNPNEADLQRNALSITPDKFTEQMKYLSENGYKTISYDTLFAALRKQTTLPERSVILTFDDGYIDFYYNAYNILRSYNLSATVFVPTGLVGQPAYLTWPMISEMYASGLINFGAHSVHHYHLASVSPDVAFSELSQSKKDLQDHLGININYMAYPYGETNSTLVGLVQKAGYVGAIGTWSGKVQSEGTIYNSPRLRISGGMSLESFAALLQ